MTTPSNRHDLPTVLAAAICAYLLGKVVHEGLGHGGACLGIGAELRGWSTSWCDCEGDAGAAQRLVKAAGTLANLGVGGLAALWLRGRPPRSPVTRYFVWLSMAVHLGLGAGYLMVDPIFGFGDWTAFLEGLPGGWGARLGLSAIGAGLFAGTITLTRQGLAGLSPEAPDLRASGRRLALLPYLAIGGAFMTAIAWRNVYAPTYAWTSALATLGGTSLLAWCWTWPEPAAGPGVAVGRSTPWLAAGAAAGLVGVLWLGPGV